MREDHERREERSESTSEKTPPKPEFPLRIANLVADPAFVRFDRLSEQPNFFAILGRTFTERWHSAFLGWFLDPDGSHGLGDFPLRRLLVTLSDGTMTVQPDHPGPAFLTPSELAREAVLRDFSGATVLPNEHNQSEKTLDALASEDACLPNQIKKDKHIDVWLEHSHIDPDPDQLHGLCHRLSIIIEMKIKAAMSVTQPSKYPDFIVAEHTKDTHHRGICIFLSPHPKGTSNITPKTIAGDKRWYCIDYQSLYDGIIQPCLERGRLRTDGQLLVDHYVRNLRASTKHGVLAMTKQDKDLALQVVKNHKETLLALAQILSDTEDEPALVDALNQTGPRKQYGSGPMTVLLSNNIEITGATVRDLFNALLSMLDKDGILKTMPMPYGEMTKKCLLNTTPIHPDGTDFRAFTEYSMQTSESSRTSIFANIWHGRDRAMYLVKSVLVDNGYTVVQMGPTEPGDGG